MTYLPCTEMLSNENLSIMSPVAAGQLSNNGFSFWCELKPTGY